MFMYIIFRQDLTQIKFDLLSQVVQILLKSRLILLNGNAATDGAIKLSKDSQIDLYHGYKNKKTAGKLEHADQERAEAGVGRHSQKRRRRQKNAHSSGRRQDYEDEKSPQTSTTHDRGPQSTVCQIQAKSSSH